MIEILQNLYIGTEQDYELNVKNKQDWRVIHACKDPYHRRLLGYTGKGAPKSHPEYLLARRGNRLFLNLVDADSPDYIPKEIIDAALQFIYESLSEGMPCLVHCNLGESRSPSIGLLYMARERKLPIINLAAAEMEFLKIYPTYNPKPGIRGFLLKNWGLYSADSLHIS